MLDLYDEYQIEKIVIWNRQDCCQDRMAGATVRFFDSDGNNVETLILPDQIQDIYELDFDHFDYVKGQAVRVASTKTNEFLNFAEIEIYARYPVLKHLKHWAQWAGNNTDPAECGDSQAIGGIKCLDEYCALMMTLCLNAGMNEISPEYWTDPFSDEQETKTCGDGELITEIGCSGKIVTTSRYAAQGLKVLPTTIASGRIVHFQKKMVESMRH